jgi:hypothetical protein
MTTYYGPELAYQRDLAFQLCQEEFGTSVELEDLYYSKDSNQDKNNVLNRFSELYDEALSYEEIIAAIQ